MYLVIIFKTIMFAGKNLMLATRLLSKSILSVGKTVLNVSISNW